jgi:hypothetical protein
MRSHGWPYPFEERPWDGIRTFLAGMALQYSNFRYLVDIADSVTATGSEMRLAGCTSMHDLIVVPRPIGDPPFDAVVVRAPGSIHPPADRHVLIEHLACTGRNERIERPAAEAVPLFWRFMIEKFGIEPGEDFAG